MDADYQDFKHKELSERLLKFSIEFSINLVMVFLKRSMRMQ